MRCTDQRQQLTIKIKTGPQHADCLKWLVGAPGIHRGVVGADRGGQTAIWIGDGLADEHFRRSRYDLDEYRVRFERAAHEETLRFDHCEEPSFCGGRTRFCVIPQRGSVLIFMV